LIFTSCNTQESEIKALFTEAELEAQNILVNYLDSQVINYSGINNIGEAYKSYLLPVSKSNSSYKMVFLANKNIAYFIENISNNVTSWYQNTCKSH